MPGVQSGNTTSASQTSITLSSTIPTRTGYTFTGWCLGSISTSNNVDSCHDVVDNTNPSNSIAAKTFSAGDSFGIDQTTINTTTLYAMWTINSNTVSITNGGNIASFSGNGTYNYGSTVSLSATKATNTTCLTYGTPQWSVTSGGVSLSTTSGTSTSFTMPDNAVSISVSSTATRNTYTITYDSNGGTGTMSNTTGYCGQSTTLRTNTFTRTGYKFLGWSTSKTTTNATYTDKQSVNLSRTSALALYAVWESTIVNKFNDVTYFSDFTAQDCTDTTDGQTGSLIDRRNNTTYTVAKINGNCWMTQNLGITGTISGTYSNFTASSVNISAGSLTSGNSYTQARTATSDSNTWYNFCAASAGTICTSYIFTDATQDICPSGWRLPTNSEFGTITSYTSAFNPVTGGLYGSGSRYNTSNGYWWSSTTNNAYGRYSLLYNDGRLGSVDYSIRSDGLYVRCVRSS